MFYFYEYHHKTQKAWHFFVKCQASCFDSKHSLSKIVQKSHGKQTVYR